MCHTRSIREETTLSGDSRVWCLRGANRSLMVDRGSLGVRSFLRVSIRISKEMVGARRYHMRLVWIA